MFIKIWVYVVYISVVAMSCNYHTGMRWYCELFWCILCNRTKIFHRRYIYYTHCSLFNSENKSHIYFFISKWLNLFSWPWTKSNGLVLLLRTIPCLCCLMNCMNIHMLLKSFFVPLKGPMELNIYNFDVFLFLETWKNPQWRNFSTMLMQIAN